MTRSERELWEQKYEFVGSVDKKNEAF
jgi:hypothetical protein